MSWISYLKVSLRTLFLHRSFSLLSLVGLSVGIAMSLIVLQFVSYQTSFDSFYQRSDDIFRVVSSGHLSKDTIDAAVVPLILAPTLEKLEGVEVLTRLVPFPERLVKSEFEESYEGDIVYADSHFFEVFDRPFLLGDSAKCLSDSSDVAISASAASRFFGTKNPLGRIITIDDTTSFTVSAVFQDVPENAHFKYDFVLSFDNVLARMQEVYGDEYNKTLNSWFFLSGYTYFRKSPKVDLDSLQVTLNKVTSELMTPEVVEAFGDSSRAHLNFVFQPIRHIYLLSDLDFEIGKSTNPVYLFMFLAVAIFILAVTAVNFINLTIARATTRFKEVGVRRIFGAERMQISSQFLVESVFFSFLALFLGLVLVELFMPFFNRLFHFELTTTGFRQPWSVLWIVGITFTVGVLSGSYPALFFSGIPPHNIFRGRNILNKKGIKLRGLLVLLQVIVALVVITIALGMNRQLRFIEKADLGFDRHDLFMIERTGRLKERVDTIIGKLKQVEGVESVVKLYNKPGDNISIISFNHGGDSSKVFLLGVQYVDCSFFDALQVEVTSGHSLKHYECSDSSKVLINETGARLLNLKTEGEYLETISHSDDKTRFDIVGVVPDIHLESLKQELRPVIYLPAGKDDVCETLLVRFKHSRYKDVSDRLRSVWTQEVPDAPFLLRSVADHVASFYAEDQRYGNIAGAFAFLALFIASLGLVGMVSFILGYKKRQMVIRWLSGASVSSVLWHTFDGYLFALMGAAIVSVPISNLLLKIWLDTFAFSYDLNLFCFLGPAFLVLLIAVVIASVGGGWILKRAFKGIRNVTL